MSPSPPREETLRPAPPPPPGKGRAPISVMGVDPGLARTGWAVVTGDSFQKLTFRGGGTIKTFPGEALSDRIGAICDALETQIRDHSVSALCLEDHFSRRNAPGVGHILGPVIGAVAYLAYRHRLSFLAIPPRELKHRVTGTGGSSKEDLIRSLSFWFGPDLKVGTTHEGDALGLAFLGFGRLGHP